MFSIDHNGIKRETDVAYRVGGLFFIMQHWLELKETIILTTLAFSKKEIECQKSLNSGYLDQLLQRLREVS